MKRIVQIFWFALVGQVAFGLVESSAPGQGFSPFQGRGMKESQGSAPNWFGASETAKPQAEESNSWFRQGIMRSARPGEMETRPKMFGGLFQKPDPSEPTMMQRASERSREMWDRTRGWASDRNEAFKNRANETWDTLTAGLRPGSAEKPTAPEPFKNPLRTAEKPDTAKSERF